MQATICGSRWCTQQLARGEGRGAVLAIRGRYCYHARFADGLRGFESCRLCCSNTCCAEHKIGSRQRVGRIFSVGESGLRMGRAIDGGEKAMFERSDTIGRRSFASTGSCCQPTALAVVPPADGQLQGIAAEMNEIPWESEGEWRLRRVRCPICVHRLTRSMRKRACAGEVHFSMRRACRKKCDADPSLTEGGRTRGSQSPLAVA